MIKKKELNNFFIKYLSITIIIFISILDILSKYFVINYIQLYDAKKIFSILNFFHVHNYGVAFSFLSYREGWQRWFLSVISLLIILIISRIIKKLKITETKKIIAFSLVIGGAIGNFINRVYYGFVIDFIDIHINNWHFATFNIADCGIFFGSIIALISSKKCK